MSRSRLLALSLVVLLLLAGCAGVSEAPPEEQNTTPTAEPETAAFGANDTVEVHNINVGQSAGTLVVGPTGERLLIDSGHFESDGEFVLSYLQRNGVDRIDYLVSTHNDADHIGGNAAVIDYYETEADGVGAVYDSGIAASTNTYEEYLDAVEEHDVTLYETREGDSIPLEGVDVNVLGPPDPYLAGGDRNENSVVLRMRYGEVSFLYTGDAEENQEQYLVERYGSAINSTVYKAGHHGSSSSSGEELLDAVDPRVAVISSGYNSQYGHPHDEVLRSLAARSVETYWTATGGDVVLVSDGEGVSIRTQASAPTDPASLYEADPVPLESDEPVTERAQIGDGPDGVSPATPTASEMATDGGSGGELAVATIHADAAGDDRQNRNDEYVVFENAGDGPLALGGWTVRDEADKQYRFPEGFVLAAGATVTLRTGSGTDSEAELYWGAGSPVWNNGGDTVVVTDADGERVLTEVYP